MPTKEEIQAKAANLTAEQQDSISKQIADNPNILEERGVDTTPIEEPAAPVAPKPQVIEQVAPPVTPVEPVVVPEAPKIEQPVFSEPVNIETPKPTPAQKIETAEDIKTKQLNIQATEESMAEANTQKISQSFATALASGNMEQARDIAINNPNLAGDFSNQAKIYLNNKAKTDFVTKYSGMSNEQMLAEVQAGNLVPGSANYALLDPQQTQAFAQYRAEAEAISVSEPFDYTASDNILSLDSITQQISKMFTTDFVEKSQELLNSDEINKTAQDLESISNQIDNVDAQIEALEDEIRAEYPTLSDFQIQSIYNDRVEDLYTQSKSLTSKYNSKLGTYQTLKDNAQTEIELLQYQDQQSKAMYQTALSLYETRRSEMREDELRKFEQQNTILAENRAIANQKALYTFQQEMENQGSSIDSYEIGRDGKMYAIIGTNAVEITGMSGGEVMFSEQSSDYNTEVIDNKDGTFTQVTSYQDGKTPSISTYDAQGNMVYGAPDELNSIIAQCRETGQCAEGTYDYLSNMGVTDLNGSNIRFGNAYTEKMRLINDSNPTVGAVAIYNPVQGAGVTGYGHTAIVTGVNQDKGTMTITDWNWEGKEKMRTNVEVPISSVTSTGGFMNLQKPIDGIYEPVVQPKYDETYAEYFKIAGSMTATQSKQMEKEFGSIGAFLDQAAAYGKEQAKNQIPALETYITDLQYLKDNSRKRYASLTGLGHYDAVYDNVIAKTSLQNLIDMKSQGATFGALSNQELSFITQASDTGKITRTQGAESYEAEIEKILTSAKAMYSDISGEEYFSPVAEPENTGEGTLLQNYQDSFNIDEYNTILNR